MVVIAGRPFFLCDARDWTDSPTVITELTGSAINLADDSLDTQLVVITDLTGRYVQSAVFKMPSDIEEGLFVITSLQGEAFVEHLKSNWVGWSKIGDITFRQDMTNDSGYKPMSWPGIVYNILKLGKNAVIYGSGGVTLMYPVSEPAPTFGFKDVMKIGLKNKGAVCGNPEEQFFIDTNGCLWKLTSEGVKRLGYEEFLNPLVDPVMFYDEVNKRVYISSATAGYLLTEEGLGGGHANVTGLQYVSGMTVFASPGELTTPEPLHIVTDTLDLGYRGMKTIEYIQIGTDVTKNLMAAIDYRYDKSEEFRTSPYTIVNNEGVAFTKAAGVDFRIRVKAVEFVEFDIDYINIQYKVTDKRYLRGVQGVLGHGN